MEAEENTREEMGRTRIIQDEGKTQTEVFSWKPYLLATVQERIGR